MTTTCIHELRAAMIRAGCFTRRELRNFPWLSLNMTYHQQRVIDAFGVGHPLKLKMMECGEVDEWNNTRYCGVPLCPRCFMHERRDQTRHAIRNTFAGVPNERLAFATILLKVQTSFTGMRNLIDSEKRRLVNFVARQRRNDARWNDLQITGWWEMERMDFADYDNAGRNTRLALDQLGFPIMAFHGPNTTVWRPHLHAIIETGGLPLTEIAAALRADGHRASYQVDIQPFSLKRSVEKNLQNVIRYSLKFRIEEGYKNGDAFDFIKTEEKKPGIRNWWRDDDIKAYGEWLKGKHMSGFRSLRFVLGKKKSSNNPPVPATKAVAKPTNPGSYSVETKSVTNGTLSSSSSIAHRIHAPGSALKSELPDTHLLMESFELTAGKGVDIEVVEAGKFRNNKVLLDTNWLRNHLLPACSLVTDHPGPAESHSPHGSFDAAAAPGPGSQYNAG